MAAAAAGEECPQPLLRYNTSARPEGLRCKRRGSDGHGTTNSEGSGSWPVGPVGPDTLEVAAVVLPALPTTPAPASGRLGEEQLTRVHKSFAARAQTAQRLLLPRASGGAGLAATVAMAATAS